MRNFLKAAWARAYIRIFAANRELSWLISEITIPVLSIAAYLLIYRSLGAPEDYEALVVLGGAMIPFWLTMLWSMASQLYWEKEVGNLDLYMIAPMSFNALLLGMAVGGMFMASARALIILLTGIFVFGVEFHVSNPFFAFLAFFLTISAIFMLGAAASSIYFVLGRTGIKLNLLLMEPVYALSGFFFPVKILGKLGAAIVSVIPITIGLDAIRQLVLADPKKFGFMDYRVELAILFVMTILFGAGANVLMGKMIEKGKKLGTLSLKWM